MTQKQDAYYKIAEMWTFPESASFRKMLEAMMTLEDAELLLECREPVSVPELAKKLKVSPVPFLIGLAISSNLQGTATLIGDPPSMILAGNLRMNFNDFFVFQGKPGIFFAVELGAVCSFIVLYLFFRGFRAPVVTIPREKVISWVPTGLLAGLVLALAVAPIWDPEFRFLGGVLCGVFGVGGILWQLSQNRSLALKVCKRYDWDTTFFLAGIFVGTDSLALRRKVSSSDTGPDRSALYINLRQKTFNNSAH